MKKYLFSKPSLAIIALVVLGGGFLIFRSQNGNEEVTYTVASEDIESVVELTGTVSSVDRADLSFEVPGTVQSVQVEDGDQVSEGQILATLSLGTLVSERNRAFAGIAAAESDVASARAALAITVGQNQGTFSNIQSAQANLMQVTAEQNTLVANAEQALLNASLQAYATEGNRNSPIPTITGTYLSDETGEYRIDLYRSSTGSGYSARYTGLENGVLSFEAFDSATPLGSRGLFISLPEPTTNSYGTQSQIEYRIPVPNPSGATYQTAFNTLNQAKATRNRTIEQAQAEVERFKAEENGQTSVSSAQERQAAARVQSALAALQQAQASAQSVNSQIEEHTLRAPFAGIVAASNLAIGETVSTSSPVVTVISDGDFEVELSVPEIDVAKIEEGMVTTITLDAYDGSQWPGVVSDIDVISTLVEGVPVYRTTVTITEPDNRIRVGMNARASITTDSKDDVIVIPRRFIETNSGKSFTTVKTTDGYEERSITTGISGAGDQIEITSGLKAGEIVVRDK